MSPSPGRPGRVRHRRPRMNNTRAMIARMMRIVYSMRLRYPGSCAVKPEPGAFHILIVGVPIDLTPKPKGPPMSGNKDKISGRVKQAAGDLTDNDDLKHEGERDEAAGKVKDTVDDAKDKVDDAIDGVKDRFNS